MASRAASTILIAHLTAFAAPVRAIGATWYCGARLQAQQSGSATRRCVAQQGDDLEPSDPTMCSAAIRRRMHGGG